MVSRSESSAESSALATILKWLKVYFVNLALSSEEGRVIDLSILGGVVATVGDTFDSSVRCRFMDLLPITLSMCLVLE